jgi:hypothetical protein
MRPHLLSFLGRALRNTPYLISNNWTGIIFSAGVFAVAFLLILSVGGWRAVKEHWKRDALIGIAAVIIGWIGLFCYSLGLTVWNDHHDMAERWKTVVNEKNTLKADIQERDKYIGQLERRTPTSQPKVRLAPLRCRVDALAQGVSAFNREWEHAKCGIYACGSHPQVEEQEQVAKNEAAIEGKEFIRDYLPKIEDVSRELRKQGLNTDLLDSRTQVTATGYVNEGLNDLIASELSVLASKLPEAQCGDMP